MIKEARKRCTSTSLLSQVINTMRQRQSSQCIPRPEGRRPIHNHEFELFQTEDELKQITIVTDLRAKRSANYDDIIDMLG